MPAIQGGVDYGTYETFIEEMIEGDKFDGQSEALEYCVRYTLSNVYDADV